MDLLNRIGFDTETCTSIVENSSVIEFINMQLDALG